MGVYTNSEISFDQIGPHRKQSHLPRNLLLDIEEEPKLMNMLGEYAKHLKLNLDALWTQCDVDCNGLLDQDECINFFGVLNKYISPEWMKNSTGILDFIEMFNQSEFSAGYIQKSEMALLLNKIFIDMFRQKELEILKPVAVAQMQTQTKPVVSFAYTSDFGQRLNDLREKQHLQYTDKGRTRSPVLEAAIKTRKREESPEAHLKRSAFTI